MPTTATPPTRPREKEKTSARDSRSSAGKQHRSWWQSAVQSIVLLVLAIVCLEGFFRFAKVGQQEFIEPDKMLGCHHIPGKLVTWRLEGFSNDRLSSAGLRDTEHSITKAAGVTRIALLGDSSTEAVQVPMEQTYGKVLEHELNAKFGGRQFEVINFACSSYSVGQEVLAYERDVRKYKPDIVLCLYNESNQTIFTPGPGKLSQPRPYFYLDNNNKLQIDNAVMAASSSKLKANKPLEFLKRYSTIYGVFSQANFSLSINEPRYRKFINTVDSLTSRLAKNDGPSTWQMPYAKQDPSKVAVALLDRLHKDVQNDGAKFAVVLFPNSAHNKLITEEGDQLRQLSHKAHFAYLDLTDPFLQSSNLRDLFLEYHFSAKGHQLVADQLLPMIAYLAKR